MNFENLYYEGFDTKENIYINKLGDISRTTKIIFPQFLQSSENYFESIFERATQTLKNIENNWTIQRTTFLYNKKITYPADERDTFFMKKKKEYHSSILQKTTENYITITLKNKKVKQTNTIFNLFYPTNKTYKKNSFNQITLSQFNTTYQEIISIFSNIDEIKIIPINTQKEISDLVYKKYFNLNIDPKRKPKQTLKSFVQDPTKSFFNIGSKILKTYSLTPNGINFDFDNQEKNYIINNKYTLPQSIGSDLNFIDYGIKKNIDKIITQVIFIEDEKSKIARILKNKRVNNTFDFSKENTMENITADFSKENNLIFHYYGITLISDMKYQQEFLNTAEKTERYLLNYGFTVTDDPKSNINYFFYQSFGNASCIPKIDRALSPLNKVLQIGIYEDLKEKEYKQGIWLKQRHSNNDYFLDLLNIESLNKNILVLGSSGTGKSVSLGVMLESFHKDGATIYLKDIGYSQKSLCEKLGGIYIDISKNNPIKLNPFSILDYNTITKEYGFDINSENESSDDLKYLTDFLFVAWKSGKNQKMTNEEESIISKTIRRYIRKVNKENQTARTKPNFQNYYNYTYELFKNDINFKDIKTIIFNKESYFLILSEYLKKDSSKDIEEGAYHYLFDKDPVLFENLQKSKFVVFEFENIKDNPILNSITSFLIASLVKKRMLSEKESGKKLIYAIDECHKFLEEPTSILEMEYSSRTFRKHNSTLILATQEIKDFTSVQKGQAILNNSSIKIIKKQSDSDTENIQKGLGLNDEQLTKLYSIAKDGMKTSLYIKIDNLDIVLNLHMDPYNLLLAETDKKVRTTLKKEIEKKGIEVAVENMINTGENKPKKTSKTL